MPDADTGQGPAAAGANVVSASPAALDAAIRAAAEGSFPAPDGVVEVVTAPVGPASGVVAFSAHFFVCAPVGVDWVAARIDTRDYTATHSPAFLTALATRIGADIGALDVVLTGWHDDRAERSLERLRRHGMAAAGDRGHPRLVRARRYRRDVRAWQVGGEAWLVIGRGVAGRWEVSFEVAEGGRGQGLGRDLAAAGRALVPPDEPTFVQVSPGNVASLRAVLAAGYVAVGSEVLLPSHRTDEPL